MTRPSRRLRRGGAVGCAVLLALAAGGCGGGSGAPTRPRPDDRRLTIYASIPLDGPSAPSGRAVLDGAKLALAGAGGRVGRYRIVLRALDDSTPQRGGWDPGQTTVDARRAALDPTTIGYIGELDSGASAVSIPLLNRAGIAQVSPWSSGAGLTEPGDGAFPGEPGKYYPTGVRTFVRVVPNDGVQARALVELEIRARCPATVVLVDGEVDGLDLAASFTAAAQASGLRILGQQTFQPRAGNYASLAAGLAPIRPACVLLSASADSQPGPLLDQVATALPHARIFATGGVAALAFADPRGDGISSRVDPRLLITLAGLGEREYPPSGREILARYAARYGPPEPASLYGYESMSLLLAAIGQAIGPAGDPPSRSAVAAALLRTRGRRSVLGTYSIDRNGDTTIRRYGVWRIVRGRMRFLSAITG